MAYPYLELLTTDDVIRAQEENGTREQWEDFQGDREFTAFDENAEAFLAARDSLYMASQSANGWPYIQHRGGPIGFLKVLSPTAFGFADYSGNKQYITVGNARSDERVSLFLMDYARRKRLKILARLTVMSAQDNPELARKLVDTDYRANVERLMLFDLVAYDWNCPQHITPRYSKMAVQEALAELKAENEALKRQLEHAR
ncbi:MAG: pyridoxamine 5'-phosphate oxidase family protein [Pseudomonadota bacterium]